MAEFPLAVSRGGRRNLAATGSTLHTAIRVWDLDAAVCHLCGPPAGGCITHSTLSVRLSVPSV